MFSFFDGKVFQTSSQYGFAPSYMLSRAGCLDHPASVWRAHRNNLAAIAYELDHHPDTQDPSTLFSKLMLLEERSIAEFGGRPTWDMALAPAGGGRGQHWISPSTLHARRTMQKWIESPHRWNDDYPVEGGRPANSQVAPYGAMPAPGLQDDLVESG